MTLDANTAIVLVNMLVVVNTALLVYQAVRLQGVHTTAAEAKDAALLAANRMAAINGAAGDGTHVPPPAGQPI